MESNAASLLQLLSRANRQIQSLLQKEIDRIGFNGDLQPGMRPIFCALADRSGVSVSDLAGHLRLAKSSVTGAVKRMEDAGLVTLSLDGEDGRRRRVKLTRKGRELVPICEGIESSIQDLLAEKMSREELEELVGLLSKLTDALDLPRNR